VEDEYVLADDLHRELERRGARVVGPIADLREAGDQISRDGFDVALIDIDLRGERSWLIADELARDKIPFCFVTGYGPEIIPERFRHILMWQKPFNPSELAEQIRLLCPRQKAAGQVASRLSS
jgi:DNA-binding response OmpR family regulator